MVIEMSKNRPSWCQPFLEEMRMVPVVTTAAKKVGMSRRGVYAYAEDHPDFKEEWQEAEETAFDQLEAVMWATALKGKGGDHYLMWKMLASRRPERWSSTGKIEVTGKGGGPLAIVAVDRLLAEAEQLDALPEIEVIEANGHQPGHQRQLEAPSVSD